MIFKRPSLWEIFLVWLLIGFQSFGGGTSTLLLIREACLKRGWLEEEEFARAWALVQVSPGINLLKLTMLVGHRLRGWPGLAAAGVGLLLPSGLVTVLMTAGFTAVRGQPLVQAAMKGILPATIGLSLAVGVQMAQPVLIRANQEGRVRLGVHLGILAGAALLMGVGGVSPALVLLLAGGAAALLLALVPARRQPRPEIDE
jgi:chromate transporter